MNIQKSNFKDKLHHVGFEEINNILHTFVFYTFFFSLSLHSPLICMHVCVWIHVYVYVCMQWGWGHIWPAPLLFWFIRLVESIITESLHLLSFITPHLFSFYSQGLAEYITDFPWGPGASSSATGDNGMMGRDFWACFIIRGICIISTSKHYHRIIIILHIRAISRHICRSNGQA